MKMQSSKLMKWVTVFVIFFGIFNMLIMLFQAEAALGIWSEEALAKWDETILWLQMSILVGRTIFGLALNVLAMLFMLNSIRFIRRSEFFSKCNEFVLWWSVPVYFIFSFCSGNMDIVYGVRYLNVNSDTFFVSLLLVGIALIYSAGVRLSEENRLTV